MRTSQRRYDLNSHCQTLLNSGGPCSGTTLFRRRSISTSSLAEYAHALSCSLRMRRLFHTVTPRASPSIPREWVKTAEGYRWDERASGAFSWAGVLGRPGAYPAVWACFATVLCVCDKARCRNGLPPFERSGALQVCDALQPVFRMTSADSKSVPYFATFINPRSGPPYRRIGIHNSFRV